ncbi:S-layer homology domain-containing protein [Cohnella nanjingensis]|uniref:S-layer homology domain-containing protein n=1 Tax=Cohnella nanjingensis TaxID=1387779 RepID=A0A7X0VH85_9BACL|nr:S-layer homology domain-containing protein [Cohnella nanjingensis]MBB6673882.1 S-layer homology domain-containing protein [Cohnella nanjingensis]
MLTAIAAASLLASPLSARAEGGDGAAPYLAPAPPASLPDAAGAGAAGAAADPEQAVASASAWAQPELLQAIRAGIATDASLDLFAQPISRERFAGLAVRLYEALGGAPSDPPASPEAGPFADTNSPEVLRAYRLGIVSGITTDAFAPNAAITREELAVMLLRAVKAARPDAAVGNREPVPAFADEDEIGAWAKDALRFAVRLGVLKGVGDNRFDPQGFTTHEQAIAAAYRTFAALRDATGAAASDEAPH